MKRMTELVIWALCLASFILVGMIGGVAWAADPPGPDVCKNCHEDKVQSYALSQHGNKGDKRTPANHGECSTCHGDGTAHVQAGGGRGVGGIINPGSSALSGAERSAACVTCHKGGKRSLWVGSVHESHDVGCTNCHKLHAGRDKVLVKYEQRDVCYVCHQTQRAEAKRISTHPIEVGKVACSDCHNPHGSEGPKLMAEKTVRDTCFTCHAEKRGPFLYEHPPASDDCMNCHVPHGSTVEPLLNALQPWLCQECHGNSAPHPGNIYSANSLPGGPVANVNTKNPALQPPAGTNRITGQIVSANNPPPQLAFRGCTNCHTQIHGSNHPAGERFVR
jgi:DmsE family decaheme c-type cytochrome